MKDETKFARGLNFEIYLAKFARMILRAVKNTKNNYLAPDDVEKYFIRKAMRQYAARIAIINRKAFGIGFQSQKGFGLGRKKFVAESLASFFIPIVGAAQVVLGFGPNGERPIHRRDLRISRKTSRHGSPGFGLRSNSASASSSACRSNAVGEPLSNKSAS
jgi:hypothetical protein